MRRRGEIFIVEEERGKVCANFCRTIKPCGYVYGYDYIPLWHSLPSYPVLAVIYAAVVTNGPHIVGFSPNVACLWDH